MKFTLAWLKQHIEINASVDEIAQALTLIGFEIESLVDKSKVYSPFIIAQIEEATQHPNAEKLRVCKVNNGKEILQIVCGASNARNGIKVVLAPIGSIIPANNLEIKQAKIRGIESNGMLCSPAELGLNEDAEGIIELEQNAIVGSKFADYANLNDVIFEIAITPNRGDAASVLGIARELAAKGLGKLKPIQEVNVKSLGSMPFSITIDDKDNCHEFLGRYISNVNNNKKNSSYSKVLQLVGLSPKNPLVDISNYSMLSYGRPNHIYDADKIKGNIVIRQSKKNEKFIALGGQEYTLPAEVLVIADDEKVLCVAGVIGGELSKVDETTKNIFIEVANFNPEAVMKSGRILNIHTDSRFRFERRVDHAIGEFFMNYITSNILESCGGQATQIQTTSGSKLKYKTSVKFSMNTIKRITGIEINKNKAQEILSGLGFKFEGNDVSIPSYRQGDIEGEEDIVEEIIRIYGYENIPSLPITTSTSSIQVINEPILDKCRRIFITRNLTELVSWSFCDEKAAKLFLFDTTFKLQNPISTDLSLMRMSILPNHLVIASQNMAYGYNNLAFFEIGFVYANSHPNKQADCLSGIRTGKHNPKSVFKDERMVDFYDVKADVYAIINSFNLDPTKLTLSKTMPAYYHPGKSAAMFFGKTLIAYCGEIHPEVAKAYEIKEMVMGFEIFINNLPQAKNKVNREAFEVSNYQSVIRDFAFILDKKQPVGDVVKTIKSIYPELIEEVELFDIYTGSEIGSDKKSVAITVKLQPLDHTLSEEEINTTADKIIATVSEKFNASLRG